MKKIIFYSLLILVCYSCSLEKRHYRTGYSFNWNKKQIESNNKKKAVFAENSGSLPVSASQKNNTEHLFDNIIIPEKRNIFSINCDTIFLKSGGRMLAKAIRVVGSEIKYKACDDNNNEELVLQKSEVDNIHHSDGGRDYFYVEEPSSRNPEGAVYGRNGTVVAPGNNQYKNNNADIYQNNFAKPAKTSLILGILGLFPSLVIGGILAICAITTGRTARQRIKNSGAINKKYDDKAKTGIILGIIGIALRVLILAALIAALAFGL